MKQLLIILTLCVTLPAFASVAGKVVGVHDGDSLTLLTAEKKQLKVRLLGIDAPELKQADGTPAKITGHWLNVRSGVRHNNTCRDFDNIKEKRKCSTSEGRACGNCGG